MSIKLDISSCLTCRPLSILVAFRWIWINALHFVRDLFVWFQFLFVLLYRRAICYLPKTFRCSCLEAENKYEYNDIFTMALNFIALKYQIIFATLKLIQIWSCDVWLNLRDVNNIKIHFAKINSHCEWPQNQFQLSTKSKHDENHTKSCRKKEENRNQTEQEKS